MSKYKRYLLFIIFYSITFQSFSQETVSQNDYIFNNIKFDYIIIKVDDYVINNFLFIKNEQLTENNKILNDLLSKDSSFLALNACITDSLCNPVGLFINNNILEQKINRKDGIGNFYLKPNGALIFTDNEVKIVKSTDINDVSRIRLGVQSGPLLLDNGKYNNSFNVNSINKKIRLGVGIFSKKNENFIVFVKTEDEVNFYDFTTIFENKFKCKNALCLESQGCVMNFPDNYDMNNTKKYCNYFILNL